MMPNVDIVVINWNSGSQLLDMISSVGRFHDGLVESLIVVDNASTDDSLARAEAMAPNLPFRLQIVRNRENRGFGAACNQGAKQATAELLLFLKILEFSERAGEFRCGCSGYPTRGRDR